MAFNVNDYKDDFMKEINRRAQLGQNANNSTEVRDLISARTSKINADKQQFGQYATQQVGEAYLNPQTKVGQGNGQIAYNTPTPVAQVQKTAAPPPSYNSNGIIDLLKKTANSTYGQAANDLKSRVAQIISKYAGQLTGLEAEYRPEYQRNDAAKYASDEATKAVLAKAGLLGSGVEVGNVKQNEMSYNQATQAIDLQKQGQQNTINNNIADTERQLEYDLNDLELQKQSYINQGMLQEAKDVRQMQREDYWKNREMELSEGQFQFEKDSFKSTMDYNYAQLSQQRDQFNKQFGLEQDKFDWSKTFEDKKFVEDTRRFDAQFGFEKERFEAEMQLESAKLKASMANANADRQLAYAKMNLEAQEFRAELNLSLKEFGLKESEVLLAENDRIDDTVNKALSEGTMSFEFVNGLIDSSMLTPMMKIKKKSMLNQAFGIDTSISKQQSYSGSGTSKYNIPMPSGSYGLSSGDN